MDRQVVDPGPLTWLAVSAEVGPGVGGGDGSLLTWLLLGLKNGVGDVLWAAKAIGVLAGTGIVVFATRMLGPWAGLWLLGQLGLLTAVVAADLVLVVVFCLLAAMSLGARGSSIAAGVMSALAVGAGPWAWPGVVAITLASQKRLMVGAVCGALCGVLLWAGVPIWPDVVVPKLGDVIGVMHRPEAKDAMLLVGLAVLILGVIRRRRGAKTLLFFSGLSLVGSFFLPQTPSSLLHVQLGLILGVAVIDTRWLLLLASLLSLFLRVPAVLEQSPSERGRAQLIGAMKGRSGYAMCTTESFVRPGRDGWLEPCIGLDHLGMSPTSIHPADVRAGAARLHVDWFAVEDRAILFTYPWLQDLLVTPYPEGFSLEAAADGWRVFKMDR